MPKPPKRREDKAADNDLWTVQQFCDWVGVSRRQYYVQRRKGLGPREVRLGYRTIRIAKDEALAWAKRLTETGGLPPRKPPR